MEMSVVLQFLSAYTHLLTYWKDLGLHSFNARTGNTHSYLSDRDPEDMDLQFLYAT